MIYNHLRAACFIILLSGAFSPWITRGETISTVRFTNENWYTLPHPKVATFAQDPDGNWSGTTEDGRLFLQYSVPNPYGIRVHRFEIEDHYHYIVDGEVADTFTEFSALLAQAYAQTQG